MKHVCTYKTPAVSQLLHMEEAVLKAAQGAFKGTSYIDVVENEPVCKWLYAVCQRNMIYICMS